MASVMISDSTGFNLAEPRCFRYFITPNSTHSALGYSEHFHIDSNPHIRSYLQHLTKRSAYHARFQTLKNSSIDYARMKPRWISFFPFFSETARRVYRKSRHHQRCRAVDGALTSDTATSNRHNIFYNISPHFYFISPVRSLVAHILEIYSFLGKMKLKRQTMSTSIQVTFESRV